MRRADGLPLDRLSRKLEYVVLGAGAVMASSSEEEVKFNSGDDEVPVVPVLLSMAAVAR
jgi:hypothetical protein